VIHCAGVVIDVASGVAFDSSGMPGHLARTGPEAPRPLTGRHCGAERLWRVRVVSQNGNALTSLVGALISD